MSEAAPAASNNPGGVNSICPEESWKTGSSSRPKMVVIADLNVDPPTDTLDSLSLSFPRYLTFLPYYTSYLPISLSFHFLPQNSSRLIN